MLFRNVTMARFGQATADTIRTQSFDGTLQDALAETSLRPVGPQELVSTGFVPPLGGDSEAMFHAVGDFIWICLGSESRLLPPAVVHRELTKRLADMEKTQGRRPGGRLRKQMKDDLVLELLPKSHVTPGRTNGYLDLANRIVVVDTPSRKAAEGFISEVRRALGRFPALMLNAEVAPRSVMTGWIAGDPLPDELLIGEECELKDAQDKGAVVRCQRQDLHSDEIVRHLESGKQVTRLGLTLGERVSFVLGEDLTLRKLKLLDGAVDSLEETSDDDLQAELDARFALMTGEVSGLFKVLEGSLKVSVVE